MGPRDDEKATAALTIAPTRGTQTASGRHVIRRSAPERADGPSAVSGLHLPALDGLRAFAVAGVFAYHLGLGWMKGGYLGVDLFFVLSGFLITSLLTEEWVHTGIIRLGAFWARRARRLLPALFVLLCAVSLFVVLDSRFGGAAGGIDLSGLRGDAISTLFYVANWHAIFAHQSYFAQFAAPSPLQHTWSLAIEEQFYLIWPPVLLVVLGRARRHWRQAGVTLASVGAVVSAMLMALLYHPGGDPLRVYFGTDTRFFDILVGATLAMVVAARPQPGPRARSALHGAALPAAGGLGAFWILAGTNGGLPTPFMFHGGFLLCAVLAAVVIADVRQVDPGPLGRLLALRPIRWIGVISYGIYLWHWPIIVYCNQERTGLSGAPLDLVRIALTIMIAAASYYLVELPIRRRRLIRRLRWPLVPAAALVTGLAVVVATIPAVAIPSQPVIAAAPSRGSAVPGSGGFDHQKPIVLPAGQVPSATRPLRVMLMGDSVLEVASPGIAAALQATGQTKVISQAFPGYGLSVINWRTGIPNFIAQDRPQLIVATWSWDDNWALAHPVSYRQALTEAVRLMLSPGNGPGADGVIFAQFPPTGPATGANPGDVQRVTAQRAAAQAAWDRIVRSLPKTFPGRVMYLPVASSLLLHGRFSSWLPPAGDPHAPPSRWVRVRMVDNVHMCAPGVARYADALLTDLRTLFHLHAPAPGWWKGSWLQDPKLTTPAGTCPDDHPSGAA